MMHLFVLALLPSVFRPLRQNTSYHPALQMTPNPSAASSENVSLVHMKLYVMLVLTVEEVYVTFLLFS